MSVITWPASGRPSPSQSTRSPSFTATASLTKIASTLPVVVQLNATSPFSLSDTALDAPVSVKPSTTWPSRQRMTPLTTMTPSDVVAPFVSAS
jgi:hypothetical protein